MSTLGQDLRYGLRTLRKSPGFAAAAVGILALGIGANSALFSVVDAVLLRPLPFPEPGRMMRLQETPPPPTASLRAASPADYFDWRAQSHSFAALAAYRGGSLTLTGGQGPEAEIKDGKVENGELSFKVVRSRNGTDITTTYTGKLDGDTIKGKIESTGGQTTRPARDWTATRAKEAPAEVK